MRGIVKLLSLVFILSLSVNAADLLDTDLEAPKKALIKVVYGEGEVMKMMTEFSVEFEKGASAKKIADEIAKHAKQINIHCKFTPNLKNIQFFVKDPNQLQDLEVMLIDIFNKKIQQ